MGNPISQLPLIMIFNYFEPEEVVDFSRVCKYWKKAAESSLVWRPFFERDCPKIPFDRTRGWKRMYGECIYGSRIRDLFVLNQTIISAYGNVIREWRNRTDQYTTVTDHQASINCFKAKTVGLTIYLFTGSADKTVKIWQREKSLFKCLNTITLSADTPTRIAAMSHHLFIGCKSGKIQHWKIDYQRNCSPQHVNTFQSNSVKVNTLLTSYHAGVQLYCGGVDGNISVWQVNENTTTLRQVLEGHHESVSSLAYSNRQQCLISTSLDKTIRIWKRNRAGKLTPSQVLTEHAAPIVAVIKCHNNDHLYSYSRDGSLKFWAYAKGSKKYVFHSQRRFEDLTITSIQPAFQPPYQLLSGIYLIGKDKIHSLTVAPVVDNLVERHLEIRV